jgi:DNA replication licensing factor MCM2
VPRQKEVILLADNIDIARPGDEVEVTGVYTHKYDYLLNVKHGFPLFSTLIEANYVKRVADSEDSRATLEELDQIK